MSTHLQTELEALEHRAGRVPRETQAHYRAALAQHLHGTLVIEAGERRVVNLHGMTQQNVMRRDARRGDANDRKRRECSSCRGPIRIIRSSERTASPQSTKRLI